MGSHKTNLPPSNNKTLILLALDDTLIATRVLYNQSYLNAAQVLINALGNYAPLGPDIFTRIEKSNKELMPVLGFSAERFPLSWVLLYRELCAQYDLDLHKEVLTEIHHAASTFQYGPFELLPGVQEALLSLLSKKEATCFILTAGDPILQRKKLKEVPILKRNFYDTNDFCIVEEKKDEFLEECAKSRDRVFMIGDSLPSDMKPANKAGVISLHIPTPGHLDYDDHEVTPDYTVSSIKEGIHIINNYKGEAN